MQPPRSLVRILFDRAESTPDQLVFQHVGDSASEPVTFAQLATRSRAIAARLSTIARAGDRALLVFAPGIDFILGFYGCLAAGVIPVPVYPPDPMRLGRTLPRLQAISRDAGATCALTTSFIQDTVAALADQAPEFASLDFLSVDTVGDGEASGYREPGLERGQPAFLQYTSGSTASPRGVMVTHGGLLANLQRIQQAMRIDEHSRLFSWLPTFHDMGLVGHVLTPVHCGCPSWLMASYEFLQQPYRWLKSIHELRTTHSGGPNFAFDLCVRKVTPEQRAGLDLSSWSVAYNGAEPISAETLARFVQTFAESRFSATQLFPCYGLAEATLFVTGSPQGTGPVTRQVDPTALTLGKVTPPASAARTLVSSGRVSRGDSVLIVNPETSRRAPPATVGEIWLHSPSVGAGYWGRPDDTRELFQARVTGTQEGPFLRTGDLGFLADGELYITGRQKDLLIIHGTNHYPQDLERTAEAAHPGMRGGCSAAFAVDTAHGEAAVLVAEIDAAKVPEPVVLAAALREAVQLGHSVALGAVVLIAARSIPKTSSGKIQRRATRAAFLGGELEVVAEWRDPHLAASALSSVGTQPVVTPTPVAVVAPVVAAPAVAAPVLRAPAAASPGAIARPSVHQPTLARPQLDRPRAELERYLLDKLAESLGRPADQIDTDETFAALGLNSVDEVELSGDLETHFACQLDPTLTWKFPTVKLLAAYLAGEDVTPISDEELRARRDKAKSPR